MGPPIRRIPWFAIAATVSALIVVVLSASSRRTDRGELLDYYDSVALDSPLSLGEYSRNVPSMFSFDHDRPDMSNGGLDLSYMAGTTGEIMPFSGVTGLSEMSAVAAAGQEPFVDTQVVPIPSEEQRVALGTQPATAQPWLLQNRAELDEGYRAAAARCNGMMHACVNWMALQTGKMRFTVYHEGSWCTDNNLVVDTCASPNEPVYSTAVLDVPAEGGELTDALWTTLQMSCPVLKSCEKPKAMSYTEGSSQYAQITAPILSQVRSFLGTQRSQSEAGMLCCIAKQTALRALRGRLH